MSDEDLASLEMTFVVSCDAHTGDKEMPLCEGGAEKAVTGDNVAEFVQLRARYMMVGNVKRALESMREGFVSCVPAGNVM